MHIKPFLLILLLVSPGTTRSPPSRRSSLAPVIRPRGVNIILGKYIVKLEDNDADSGSSIKSFAHVASLMAAEPDTVYNMTGFRGFVGSLTDDKVESLRHHPAVSYLTRPEVWMQQWFMTRY